MSVFVAIDFETSHHKRDSACSVGLVRAEGGQLVQRAYRLIRPPRRTFMFTQVHGLRWSDVSGEPAFAQVWAELAPMLEGAELLVAHNAPFDRSVLRACCEAAQVEMPRQPFACTVQLSRKAWGLKKTRLSNVCAHLDIPLQHHHALSDAEACARVYIEAQRRLEATAPRLF
jgi:DNA polymerase-3 subunit epsilon